MKLALVRARVAALYESRWCKPALRVLLAAAALVALAAIGRFFATPPVQAAPATVAVAPAPSAALATASAGEGAPPASSSPATPAPETSAASVHHGPASPEDPVVLNHATESDLQRLPGIGAKRASAIIALRTKLGRFRQIEDLLRVRGIGRRTLMRLRPLVRLDPLPQPDGGAS